MTQQVQTPPTQQAPQEPAPAQEPQQAAAPEVPPPPVEHKRERAEGRAMTLERMGELVQKPLVGAAVAGSVVVAAAAIWGASEAAVGAAAAYGIYRLLKRRRGSQRSKV